MPFGYSLSIPDCLSIKQPITNQAVRLNNDVALKKDKKFAQHYGKYKMQPLHEGNFYPQSSPSSLRLFTNPIPKLVLLYTEFIPFLPLSPPNALTAITQISVKTHFNTTICFDM